MDVSSVHRSVVATKRVSFETDPADPPIVQAISLALAILRFTKLHRWSDLNQLIPYSIELLDGQLDLLRDHLTVLGFIRSSAPDPNGGPRLSGVTIVHCPDCGRWQLTEPSKAPKACQLGTGCTATPVKALTAPRRNPDNPVPAQPDPESVVQQDALVSDEF